MSTHTLTTDRRVRGVRVHVVTTDRNATRCAHRHREAVRARIDDVLEGRAYQAPTPDYAPHTERAGALALEADLAWRAHVAQVHGPDCMTRVHPRPAPGEPGHAAWAADRRTLAHLAQDVRIARAVSRKVTAVARWRASQARKATEATMPAPTAAARALLKEALVSRRDSSRAFDFLSWHDVPRVPSTHPEA